MGECHGPARTGEAPFLEPSPTNKNGLSRPYAPHRMEDTTEPAVLGSTDGTQGYILGHPGTPAQNPKVLGQKLPGSSAQNPDCNPEHPSIHRYLTDLFPTQPLLLHVFLGQGAMQWGPGRPTLCLANQSLLEPWPHAFQRMRAHLIQSEPPLGLLFFKTGLLYVALAVLD